MYNKRPSGSICVAAFSQATYALNKGIASGSLRISLAPFYTMEGICLGLLTILLLLDFIISVIAIFKDEYAEQVASTWV